VLFLIDLSSSKEHLLISNEVEFVNPLHSITASFLAAKLELVMILAAGWITFVSNW
jgi:hypothetical protein